MVEDFIICSKKLIDNPKLDLIANKLQEYLKEDSVPRTKNSVKLIINNIFEIDE